MQKQKLLELAKPQYNENQILELEHAIDFAENAHKGQKRRSGDPYISHPLSVAGILISWTMDIDSVLAGVLHDTVEDTDATLEDVESLFGAEVAFLVDGVTKVSAARSGMDSLDTYRPQTKDNLAKLLIAIGHDVRVIIIKLADRLHNLQTLNYMLPDKQIKIARESLDIFAPMADRIGMGRVRMQIEDISFKYLAPSEYKKVEHLLKKRLGKSTKYLGNVRSEVEKRLKEESIEAEVNGRVKTVYSLYRKLKKVENIEDIYDLMALRVIVDNKEDCYKVLSILHSMYEPIFDRIKDYINQPKPNGYQSLHTTVKTPKDSRVVEFQIRTKRMHEYAEQGLAASFHYHEKKDSKEYTKKKKQSSSTLPKQLKWITDLQKVASKLHEDNSVSREQLYLDLFEDTIFVYSPRGDIFSLPEGSLPLDFAYLVHSDVGKHAYGFKVNGKIHAFSKPLKSGDVIEVITRDSASPKQAWQNLITTHHARNKLRMQLRKLGIIGAIGNAAAIIRNKALRKK